MIRTLQLSCKIMIEYNNKQLFNQHLCNTKRNTMLKSLRTMPHIFQRMFPNITNRIIILQTEVLIINILTKAKVGAQIIILTFIKDSMRIRLGTLRRKISIWARKRNRKSSNSVLSSLILNHLGVSRWLRWLIITMRASRIYQLLIDLSKCPLEPLTSSSKISRCS